jgi:hypothetical protein
MKTLNLNKMEEIKGGHPIACGGMVIFMGVSLFAATMVSGGAALVFLAPTLIGAGAGFASGYMCGKM